MQLNVTFSLVLVYISLTILAMLLKCTYGFIKFANVNCVGVLYVVRRLLLSYNYKNIVNKDI